MGSVPLFEYAFSFGSIFYLFFHRLRFIPDLAAQRAKPDAVAGELCLLRKLGLEIFIAYIDLHDCRLFLRVAD